MIILQCVLEKSKLRVKFHSYINSDGTSYRNVYDNRYNCQFPRDIRVEGRYYSIGDDDLALVYDGIKAPFYKVSKHNIQILTAEHINTMKLNLSGAEIKLEEMKIYEVEECIICFAEPSNMVFIPCAHCAVCEGCHSEIHKRDNKCPLCRKNISMFIKKGT